MTTDVYQQLFMLQAKLTYFLELPEPKAENSAKFLAKKKKKYQAFLNEILEIEHKLEYYEVETKDLIYVKQKVFEKQPKNTTYEMVFNGKFVKLALMRCKNITKWVIWVEQFHKV